MKKIYELLIAVSLVAVPFTSCTDTDWVDSSGWPVEGAPLHIYVGVDATTRVAELPNINAINEGGEDDLNHVGLYVYYTSDYNDNDLSQPYIRNMECQVENGLLVPVLADGEDESHKNIYIYDYMTVVAFYPYNEEMSLQDNWFSVKGDEENYPVTRADYSEQTYIPYRGAVEVNPTTAYYIELYLVPKHTFRLEIILVSEDTADFNEGGEIKLLPAIDPVDNEDTTTDGKREEWYDQVVPLTNTGGGMHVRRYIAYIWQDAQMNHIIQQNEVLYENGNFTLLATEEVDPKEREVYRYGYNFTTGESFIPTSSNLIYDAASLQGFGGVDTEGYQVCDIDLTGINFQPLSMINSRYDGGGHKISNLNISTGNNEAGLFSQILGNSTLKNVNLMDPVITMNTSVDTCYAGALCGRVNSILSEDELEELFASINLPENLSDVVRAALIQEIMAGIFNSQSQVMACRVENPQITVTGTHPRVGTVFGANGERLNDDTYKGVIWDTYSLGGTITVNSSNPAANAGAAVGGFCGLNEFYITRCYTTIPEENITAMQNVTVTGEDGQPVIEEENIFQGFAYQGTLFTAGEGAGINDSYAVAPDTNSGVSIMPGAWPSGSWVTYTGVWPINTLGWTNYSANSYWYTIGTQGAVYPVLQWERR